MQIAICDDEKIFREKLKEILIDYKTRMRLCIDIFEFESGEALLGSATVFDMVFMDFQMTGMDGMQAAEILRKRNALCSIVFITSYPQFVCDSFSVDAFRFLIKPIDRDEVCEALDNYIANQKLLYPIIINNDGEQKIINAQDIIFLEGDGKYCNIITEKDLYHSSKTLSQVFSSLPQHCFCRIHKSYAINMYFIKSVKENTVYFLNGEKATISRNRIAEFKKIHRDFIKNYYSRM